MRDEAKGRIEQMEFQISNKLGVSSGYLADSVVHALKYAIELEEKFDRYAMDSARRLVSTRMRFDRIEERIEDLVKQASSLLGKRRERTDLVEEKVARHDRRFEMVESRLEALAAIQTTPIEELEARSVLPSQTLAELIAAARATIKSCGMGMTVTGRLVEALKPFEHWGDTGS